MARLVRPTWAIRCTQSGCKQLFEVAILFYFVIKLKFFCE